MKNRLFRISAIALVGALMLVFGCGGPQVQTTQAPFSAPRIDAAAYNPKVDSFLVLFDGSSSMSSNYQGTSKFVIAKNLVEALNQSIPELGYTAHLRSFGPDDGTNKETSLVFGPAPYSTQEYGKSIATLRGPAGNTPIGRAIEASLKDIEGQMSGKKTAVIIVSDGKDPIQNPEAAIRNFKLANPNACFYPILVGDDAAGRALMEGIAEVGQCGFMTTADNIHNTAGMADFVEKVFLAEKPAPTPPPVAPPAPGPCPDSDNDGVCDDADRCPGTPAGVRVDQFGCWVLGNVLFDFDKAVIKQAAYPLLNEVADTLKRNPNLNVTFEGHTDSIGTDRYNQKLSERRANAVLQYMLNKGIPASQIGTAGYGESQPRATNQTEEGRAHNRRVEITPR